MLISANDAANIIAKYVGGSISQFMADLNDYLEEIGCKNTKFRNPHGLHLPGHRTTAYDMALITCEAVKYPLFRKIIGTQRYSVPSRAKENGGILFNSNLLIRSGQKYFYPHAIGGKTGVHSEAQNSLIAVASHKGRNLITVLLQCTEKDDMFADAKKLFEAAFLEGEVEEVYLTKGAQPFSQYIAQGKKNLKTYLDDDVRLKYYPSEKPQVSGEILWLDHKLPIAKGDPVATLTLKSEDGNILKVVELQACYKVAGKSNTKRIVFYILLIICVSLIFIGGNYVFRSSSKQ